MTRTSYISLLLATHVLSVICDSLYYRAKEFKKCPEGFKACEKCGNFKQRASRLHQETCFYVPAYDKCYWTKDMGSNFASTKTLCLEKGMRLVEQRTRGQSEAFFKKFRTRSRRSGFWLGIHYDRVKKKWRYLSDDSELSNSNYHGVYFDLSLTPPPDFDCLITQYYPKRWRFERCSNSYDIVCEGTSTISPGRPELKIDNLDKQNLELPKDEKFTLRCSGGLNGVGELSFAILETNKTVYIEKGSQDMSCVEDVNENPDNNTCTRTGECALELFANMTYNNARFACISYKIQGTASCTENDPFCTIVGPVKVVEKIETTLWIWFEMLAVLGLIMFLLTVLTLKRKRPVSRAHVGYEEAWHDQPEASRDSKTDKSSHVLSSNTTGDTTSHSERSVGTESTTRSKN